VASAITSFLCVPRRASGKPSWTENVRRKLGDDSLSQDPLNQVRVAAHPSHGWRPEFLFDAVRVSATVHLPRDSCSPSELRVYASHTKVASQKREEIATGPSDANEAEGAVVRSNNLLERAEKHRVEFRPALLV
jgi:hypothetical protein